MLLNLRNIRLYLAAYIGESGFEVGFGCFNFHGTVSNFISNLLAVAAVFLNLLGQLFDLLRFALNHGLQVAHLFFAVADEFGALLGMGLVGWGTYVGLKQVEARKARKGSTRLA